MRPGRLFILLPVHDRREITERFVVSLTKQTLTDFQLVVIDDGCTDGTANAVREILPGTEVVRGSGDLWWAGALAAGAAHLHRIGIADEDVVLIINDDVEITPEFLAEGVAELGERPATLLLARQMNAETGQLDGMGGGVRADLRELRFYDSDAADEINCLSTRGLFLRWADWKRAGGFIPERIPHYLSDYEFTLRAKRRGLLLRVARSAKVGARLEMSGLTAASIARSGKGLAERVRLLFSLRNKDNPVVWSRFVQEAAEPGRRPYLWVKVWGFFLCSLARVVFQGKRLS